MAVTQLGFWHLFYSGNHQSTRWTLVSLPDNVNSLPGAIGMYALSLGILQVGSTLPTPVFALLSGLNAATVGIIALAAVRLAEKAITDKVTRALVYLGGILGMLHTALWYYPVIMVGAGLTTMIWDLRYPHAIIRLLQRCRRKSAVERKLAADLERYDSGSSSQDSEYSLEKPLPPLPLVYKRERTDSLSPPPLKVPLSRYALTPMSAEKLDLKADPPADFPAMSWKFGALILTLFVATFVTILVLNIMYPNTSRGFSLFADLYLAGTIIFGGGPVVIPLLREYIVTQGWVSPRNFLLGLAVIQAFPGPNFNFAVYLGSLATAGTSLPSIAGAMIAFVAIFTPGLIIVLGFMGLWSILKSRTWFLSILRGVNAAAVGLVYTAVYKLWEMGYLTAAVQGGSPLGTDPWLVAITATAFVGCAWFKLNPPLAILLGGTLGMLKYAVVRS